MIRFLVALLLFVIQKKADANSSGAGGCAGGMAAVGGLHLDTTDGRSYTSGTLADVGVVVQIGTTVLDVSVVNDFPIGQDLQISVNTAAATPYKGVLVRLEAPAGVNTVAALMPGTNTAIATQCVSPILGITHTNSNFKSTSTGTIRFDEEVLNVVLGITVVYFNDDILSAYIYSAFKVNFRAAQTPVTPPVVPPTPVTPPVVPPTPVTPPVVPPTPVTPPVVPPTPLTPPAVLPTPVTPPFLPPTPVTPPVVAPTPVTIPSPTPPVTAPVAPVPGMGGGGMGVGMTVGMGGGGGMGMG